MIDKFDAGLKMKNQFEFIGTTKWYLSLNIIPMQLQHPDFKKAQTTV